MSTKPIKPKFAVSDIVRVCIPTQAINIKLPPELVGDKPEEDEGPKKLNIEECLLIGDEALVIAEVEVIDKTSDVLYSVIAEVDGEQKIFSLSEDQITLYEEE